ncbi:MAG: FkbM family methyltransferase [Pseudomonadota bacterium]
MASIELQGVFRSLRTYYGDDIRDRRMDATYAAFLRPGDLAFDIGSHVGDRIASFRRLGARVVALEPQPLPFRAARLIHTRDDGVTLIGQACGAEAGLLDLHVNEANPTVSTASPAFINAADGQDGWREQSWTRKLQVPVTTLDALMADFGTPDFVKIDVEGFELNVINGLSRPIDALSFEFTTIQRDVALDCLKALSTLGPYRFNMILGESYAWQASEPMSGNEMARKVDALPHEANSGDIYASLTWS